MRSIDADALEKTLRDWIRDHWTEAFTGDDAGAEFADMIEHAETIDAVPSAQPERKTGHWIKTGRWGRVYYCDQCRNYLDFDGVNVGRGSTNFCPNCGADMRGEQE